MKKFAKAVLGLAALSTAMGFFASCGGGGGDDDYDAPVKFETEGAVGNVVTFTVTENSTTTGEGTNKLVMSMRRSEAGAAEKLILQGAKYKIQYPNEEIKEKTGDLTLALNDYGSCFCFEDGESSDPSACTGNHYDSSGKIINDADKAEYQCELSLDGDFKKGDVVKFQLISAKVSGEGVAKKADLLPKIKIALVDGHKAVNWYKLLFAKPETGFPTVFKTDAQIDDGETEDHGLLGDASFNVERWKSITISADKLTGVEAGDKIVVTFEVNNDGEEGYHMYQLWDASKNEQGEHFAEITDINENGKKATALTEEQANAIKANGLKIQGNSLTLTKVEIVKAGVDTDPVAGDNLLTAEKTPDWGGSPLTIASENFNKATVTSSIVITIGTDSSEGTNQLKLTYTDWSDKFCKGTVSGGEIGNSTEPLQETPGYEGAPVKEDGKYENTAYGRIDLSEKTVTYTPTEAEWATIKASGMMILGNGCSISSVVFTAGN